MSNKFSVKGWQIELGWQGMTLTPPEQVAKSGANSGDRYREIKLEARPESWMQAAEVFTPGGMLFAPVPVRRQREQEKVRRRNRRRSF